MEFNGKIDQLAFIAHNDIDEIMIKRQLGLQEADWVEDICVAQGVVRGTEGANEAKLLFNYDLGIEVEILRYLHGPNYAENLRGGSLCHYGIHYSGKGDVPTFDAPIIQQVNTISHTNAFLLERGRRYRYTIYDTLQTFNVYTKVIERIEPVDL